jgi:sec-independent protein translocase protein TatA
MIANIFGGDGLIVVILAVVVLFGGSQLPKLAKNVGSAGREFRKAQEEASEDAGRALADAPAPAPHLVAAVVSPPIGDDDKVVISRSDLRRELSGLLAQRQEPPAH